MPKLTNAELIDQAVIEKLPRRKAEELETEVRDLISSLEGLADELDAYAIAEGREEISDTREQLAATAGDTLSDLRAFGFTL